MNLWYSFTLLATIALVGCGNDTASQSNATATESTTTKVSSSSTENVDVSNKQEYVSPLPNNAPTYTMGTMDYTPFAFRDEYGHPIGYDVDLIRAIGEEVGFKVEINQLPFSDLLQSVQDGKVDFAMSGLSVLPERQAKMLSSTPYSKGKPGYLVEESSTNRSIDELHNKKIAVLANSSLHAILDEEGVEKLVLEPSMFLSFQAIFTKKADAAFGMQPTLFYASNQFKENPVKFIAQGEPIMTTVYAGKDKQEIIDLVNDGLQKVKSNGKYEQINTKWFGDNASEIAIN